MAHQHDVVIGIRGELWIQLLDQNALTAIVNARAVLRKYDIAEVLGFRRLN